jgi:hypothetical protein
MNDASTHTHTHKHTPTHTKTHTKTHTSKVQEISWECLIAFAVWNNMYKPNLICTVSDVCLSVCEKEIVASIENGRLPSVIISAISRWDSEC